MALIPNTRRGRYKVTARIGVGGMEDHQKQGCDR